MRVVTVKSLARASKRTAYRSAVALALLTAALLAWLALGVGIIRADGDPANALYAGVLAFAGAGAAIARLQPRGMARALLATRWAHPVPIRYRPRLGRDIGGQREPQAFQRRSLYIRQRPR